MGVDPSASLLPSCIGPHQRLACFVSTITASHSSETPFSCDPPKRTHAQRGSRQALTVCVWLMLLTTTATHARQSASLPLVSQQLPAAEWRVRQDRTPFAQWSTAHLSALATTCIHHIPE